MMLARCPICSRLVLDGYAMYVHAVNQHAIRSTWTSETYTLFAEDDYVSVTFGFALAEIALRVVSRRGYSAISFCGFRRGLMDMMNLALMPIEGLRC